MKTKHADFGLVSGSRLLAAGNGVLARQQINLRRGVLGIMACTGMIIAGGVQQAWASAGCDAVNASMVTKDHLTTFYANVGPYTTSIGPTTPTPITETTITGFAVGDTINIHIQGQGHGSGTWTLRNGNGGLLGTFTYINNAVCDLNNDFCHGADRTYTVTGENNDTTLTQRVAISGAGVTTAHSFWPISCTPAANVAPTANAGPDQAIRAGDTVNLDGGASFDDNTATSALGYAWTFSSRPEFSLAELIGDDTATPSFTADVAGTYVVELVVTDEGGLQSVADQVEISSDNLAPAAAAGSDQLVIVGNEVVLDGSASSDPENDELYYDWAITTRPDFSTATLSGYATASPSFTPDLEGVYEVTLTVSDFIGAGTPDTVAITATTAEGFAETQIVAVADVVVALLPGQVTTGGNQNALQNFLSQAIVALQEGDIAKAIDKLEKAIERTDGCAANGTPDGNGKGRDWITDCDSQAEVYALLNDALNALLPL